MATPFWERFCTPLAKAILAMLRPPPTTRGPAADAPYILEETVEAVLGDGRYRIGGDSLATKGRAALRVGQRVHVFWRNGKRERILTHQWQRAQGGAEELVGYAVEELLLIEADAAAEAGARWDVYFRNDQQVTRLNLSSIINADHVPAASWSFGSFGPNETGVMRVGWGQADDMFYVMTQAARTPLAAPIRYYPRFYVFQLARAEGVPAGATPQSATLVATVDLPQFTMAAKYGSMIAPATTPTPPIFPDDLKASGSASPINGFFLSEIVLERDGKIVMIAPRRATNGYTTFTVMPVVEEVTYLVAVRSDAAAVIWESPVTDANRAVPPFSSQGGSAIAVPYTAYQVDLLGFAVLEWSDSVRRVATSWQAESIHDTNVAPRVITVVQARRAVFVEDGTATPVAEIQPWTDFPTAPDGGSITAVDPVPQRLPMGFAQPDRLLLTGRRTASIGPTVIEQRVELWNGATLTVLGLALGDEALITRAAALRLLPADTTYVIAEDASATGWPPDSERARFTLLTGERPLDLDQALVNDPAHEGPLAPLPAGLAAPDGATEAQRVAYHVVGTVT